jgi:hypothetical protein
MVQALIQAEAEDRSVGGVLVDFGFDPDQHQVLARVLRSALGTDDDY